MPTEKENTRNRQHSKKHKNKLSEYEYDSEETTGDFTISEKIRVERICKVNSRQKYKKKENILKDDKIISAESGNDSEIPQENLNFSYFEENSHVVPKKRLDGYQVRLQDNSNNIFSVNDIFYSMLPFEFIFHFNTIVGK